MQKGTLCIHTLCGCILTQKGSLCGDNHCGCVLTWKGTLSLQRYTIWVYTYVERHSLQRTSHPPAKDKVPKKSMQFADERRRKSLHCSSCWKHTLLTDTDASNTGIRKIYQSKACTMAGKLPLLFSRIWEFQKFVQWHAHRFTWLTQGNVMIYTQALLSDHYSIKACGSRSQLLAVEHSISRIPQHNSNQGGQRTNIAWYLAIIRWVCVLIFFQIPSSNSQPHGQARKEYIITCLKPGRMSAICGAARDNSAHMNAERW